jgi:hypothetical protein
MPIKKKKEQFYLYLARARRFVRKTAHALPEAMSEWSEAAVICLN